MPGPGVQPPATLDGAWGLAEFEAVLERLKRSGVAYPLDMKLNYGAGEWFAYGFAPIIASFGGQLIDPKDFRSAEGFLDGPGPSGP